MVAIFLTLPVTAAVSVVSNGCRPSTPKSAEEMARMGKSPIPLRDMSDAQQILIQDAQVKLQSAEGGEVPSVSFHLINQSDVSLSSVSLKFQNVSPTSSKPVASADGFISLDPMIEPDGSRTIQTRAWSKERNYGFPITSAEVDSGNELKMQVTHIVGARGGVGVVFRNLSVLDTSVKTDALRD